MDYEKKVELKLVEALSKLTSDQKAIVTGYAETLHDKSFTPTTLEELIGSVNGLGLSYTQETLDVSFDDDHCGHDVKMKQVESMAGMYSTISLKKNLDELKSELLNHNEHSRKHSSMADCADALIDFLGDR